MEATIKINEAEFDYSFFKKVKNLFKGGEIEIGGKTQNDLRKEKYRQKIDKSIENIERGENLIEFSGEEFEALVAKLSNQ